MNFWGSKPGDNDDCHTGDDYETREQAEAELNRAVKLLEGRGVVSGCTYRDTQYVELDGPDVHLEVRIKAYRPRRDSDADWRREYATQQGMAFGCAGYNDAMGW